MILTAHQPVYLPWLGLFHKIACADAYCYFDAVQYVKKEWNNRNRIKTAQGPIWLSVPVLTSGYLEKPLCEIKIDNTTDWSRKHWRSLSISYAKAPYFRKYSSFFESVYARQWTYLSDLNEHMLKWFLDELGIPVSYYKASTLHFVGTKSDLVLDMCKKLGANVYIFGTLGKDYANVKAFENAGIKVIFQDYKHPVYSQLHGAFVPNLSLVDLMFNCGGGSLDVLMRGNIAKTDL